MTGSWATLTGSTPPAKLLSTNHPTVHCPSGTYVVLLDGHPHKVAVR